MKKIFRRNQRVWHYKPGFKPQRVRVLSQEGDFVRVRAADGQIALVFSANLKRRVTP